MTDINIRFDTFQTGGVYF